MSESKRLNMNSRLQIHLSLTRKSKLLNNNPVVQWTQSCRVSQGNRDLTRTVNCHQMDTTVPLRGKPFDALEETKQLKNQSEK